MLTSDLDQRVTFLRPTVSGRDAMGGDIAGSPTTVGTFWANVHYLSGREFDLASQRWGEARYVITIFRQPGVTLAVTDYVEWNGQTLDIVDIAGQGTRDEYWLITAKDFLES